MQVVDPTTLSLSLALACLIPVAYVIVIFALPDVSKSATFVQHPLWTGLGRAGVGGHDRHAGRVPSSG